MQPRGKGRFTPKSPDLAEELKKSLLREIFRIRRVADHAQAQGVNPAAVHLVQKLESGCIPGLRAADGFRLGPRYRLGWSLSGQLCNSGATTLSDAPNPPKSCIRYAYASRPSLLSLDRGHPSMVKIASLGRKKVLWIGRALPEGRKE